jgi:hypothetical protein
MKLTKRDVAEVLGLKFISEAPTNFGLGRHSARYAFEFRRKVFYNYGNENSLDEAWEEAAEKLLEPLVDYLLGNLDDE